MARLLLDQGVSHHTLFDIYHSEFTREKLQHEWQLHLSVPLRFVLERWVEASVGTRMRPPAQAHIDDILLRLEDLAPYCPAAAQKEVRQWNLFAQSLKGGNK